MPQLFVIRWQSLVSLADIIYLLLSSILPSGVCVSTFSLGHQSVGILEYNFHLNT